MKSLLTLLAVFACLLASAQAYKPFPTSDATWSTYRCWYFYSSGVYDEILFYMDGRDTVVNSVTYKSLTMKFYHAPGTAFDSSYVRHLGGIRESNRQIFFVSEDFCGDTIERLIYDFNYDRVGDTIYTSVLLYGYSGKVPHVVTAIDSVQVGAAYHRRLHLSDTLGNPLESWIEGVGSNWGLPYATYWIITDNSYDLGCFKEFGGLKYQNPSPGYAFCIAPYPEIQCDSSSNPNAGCTAAFTFTRQNDTISFAGTSNHVGASTWQWDFGDNQFDYVQSPQHIYQHPGWYETCLTVTGLDSTGANCSVTVCDSVYITDGCIDSSQICLPPGGSLCCDAPIEEPVCGCDSVTYNNGCQATLWYGVIHYTDGPCITGINDKSIFKKIKLLPNPAGTRTTLMLETSEQGIALIYLRNILGEVLLTHQQHVSGKTRSTIEMQLDKIPPGIYFVEMQMNNKLAIKKLVRE